MDMSFEWDEEKNWSNLMKHGVSFSEAQEAFHDPLRLISMDRKHSTKRENRYFCLGRVRGAC
jgi:uncharacterized protein